MQGARSALKIIFVISFSLIFVWNGLWVDVEAKKEASLTGEVISEDEKPICGANITIVYLDNRPRFVKRIISDANGRFYTSIDREGSYLIYVTYDDEKTPGVEYVPERWRTWLSLDSVSSRKFILKRGASVYLDGDIRHVETNRVAASYQFVVLEPTGGGEDQWTGPVREYGSFSGLVRFLGFDERLVIIPAETEVKIQVTANFPAGQSQTFIVKGKAGYFKLPQGEILHIDVREHNIISNMEYVKGTLCSSFYLLDDCRTAGFLVETERKDLLNAYDLVEESLFLLRRGFPDQSFAKLRSAYILATRTESALEGLINSGSQSLLPLLFLFLFVAFASAHLITEKSTFLQIVAGERIFLVSTTSLVEAAFYVLLFVLLYLVFPGCRLIPQLTYISMSIFVYLVGKAIMLLFPRLSREEESEDQPIQLKSAVAVAFLMGCRNLRRRRMRTLINLISVMVLVFGFITLTSISPEYGLLTRRLRPVLPVDALLVRDEPLGGYPGSFLALPESFIEWLESQPNVTLVSPKAENMPVYFDRPLGSLYSSAGKSVDILGIIGIIPSKEEKITGFNQIVEGKYLEDDDVKGILISSSLKKSLGVDVGDKLYGFDQEFVVRGFFDGESLSRLMDVNALKFLPYYRSPVSSQLTPCPSDRIIILTYKKALTLPNVYTSRVAVQFSNIESYESLARIIALTYEYKVYVSHPESLTLHSLGEYTEEQGVGLIFPLMVLVMLNIGLSMFATVNERKDEIASLSSVGLNPTQIAVLFIAEALIIGFIGGGFGYLLGISGYRIASMLGGLQVREKVSAEWGVGSIFLSGFTATIASLIPALRSSTLVTPSLLRKWKIGEKEHPIRTDEPWALDLPVKIMGREIEAFTAFVVKELRKDERTIVDKIRLEKETSEDGKIRIIFDFYVPDRTELTTNELIIQPGEGKEFDLKLLCTLHGSPSNPRDTIRRAATYVRKLLLEWSAATCEIVTPFDPYMTRVYNLVNVYNPTTLYLISTYQDTYDETNDKINAFRDALILRGIRPPKFAVSHVNPLDLEQTMKIIKDLVSRADIICVSGENATLSAALAAEAAQQKKMLCYVIDGRPVAERIKEPFKDLKIVSFTK